MRRGLLLVVPPFALAACGGSSPAHMSFRLNGTTVPASVVRGALVKTAEAPSAHFLLSVRDKSYGCTTTARSSGDVDNLHRVARIELNNGRTKAILAGPNYYTRSSHSRWQKADLHRFMGLSAATLPWFVSAPGQLLGPLAAIPRVIKGGRETIGGVPTTKYEALLRIRRQRRARPVYLWLDRKDHVRQLQLNVFFGVATMRLSRFGEHVHVTVPRGIVTAKGGAGSWEAVKPCK